MSASTASPITVSVDLSDVRPVGETLKGFGGMANPVKLGDLYGRVAQILNKANGRQLTSVECCLLIDEAAVTIVAGNIRRSAGMRQFAAEDTRRRRRQGEPLAAGRARATGASTPSAMRCGWPTTRACSTPAPRRRWCWRRCVKQFQSGEGAIQFAPEAIARSNADLLHHPELRSEFIDIYVDQGREEAGRWLQLQPSGDQRRRAGAPPGPLRAESLRRDPRR